MSAGRLTEAQLEAIERQRSPDAIPDLVRTIREQQHELDRLRLSLEVARKEREDLRMELVRRGKSTEGGGRSTE